MRADIKGGHLQVYPEDEVEATALERFISEGVNKTVGSVRQKIKNNIKLDEKVLVMVQFTVAGTKLADEKEVSPERRVGEHPGD